MYSGKDGTIPVSGFQLAVSGGAWDGAWGARVSTRCARARLHTTPRPRCCRAPPPPAQIANFQEEFASLRRSMRFNEYAKVALRNPASSLAGKVGEG